MTLELRAVTTENEWAAMHDIRRRVLFAPGRHRIDIEYNDQHPDDRAEGHVPHILMLDEQPIGVARLDMRGAVAVIRLVAVEPAEQRKGHGQLMDRMLAEKAWGLGVKQLHVNAAPTAVGFYEKCGWRRESWDPDELIGIAGDCVQMVKDLD